MPEVPLWGRSNTILSSLSPKRDGVPEKVEKVIRTKSQQEEQPNALGQDASSPLTYCLDVPVVQGMMVCWA